MVNLEVPTVQVVKAIFDPNANLRCIPYYKDSEGNYVEYTKEDLDNLFREEYKNIEV